MDKEIDPSNIGKHENLIKQAQVEMAKTDVLVCGKCHNVYHFIELFKQHKDKGCTKDSSLKDCVSFFIHQKKIQIILKFNFNRKKQNQKFGHSSYGKHHKLIILMILDKPM